jgi:hypothetical protein
MYKFKTFLKTYFSYLKFGIHYKVVLCQTKSNCEGAGANPEELLLTCAVYNRSK